MRRREALGLLLGAPLAAAACKRIPFHHVPGEIRGASMAVGHRLRDRGDATVERASGAVRHVEIAIVGAGPSGLSAAWRLERLGERRYAIFDLEAQAGGTSSYGTDGVVAYPWGAHYVPLPRPENRATTALFEEMGVFDAPGPDGVPRAREELLVREPEERLYLDGEWREGLYPAHGASAADLAELARFRKEVDRWIAFRDGRGRRAFTLPVAACSDDAEVTALDRKSAEAWLRDRGFSSTRLAWFVAYACRDDYGLSLAQTSAWAMLFYFAARVPAPGVESAPFVAWPEGNGRIVRHLAGVAAGRVHTGKLVTDFVPGADSVELAVFDPHSGALERWSAAQVILAVPKLVLPRIVRPWRAARPEHLAAFSYGVWLVANLHLFERPKSKGAELAWDNVLHDSPGLGYVVATHQALRDRGPSVWTYYRPFTDSDPDAARRKLADLGHEEIADAVLSDLGRAHSGLERAVERLDVWKWGHAMIRPVPGFVWGAARRRAAEPLGRVHFAHSDLSGLALFEEAQDRGVRAAEAVLRARGREIVSLVD